MGWLACRRGFSLADSGKHLGNRFARSTGPPVQKVLCSGIRWGQCGTTRMVWHVDGGNSFHGRAVLGKSIAAMSWGPVIRLCSRSSHTMRAAGKQPHKGLSHAQPGRHVRDRLCVVRAREVAAAPTTIGAASGGDHPIFRSVSCTAPWPSCNCDGGCL